MFLDQKSIMPVLTDYVNKSQRVIFFLCSLFWPWGTLAAVLNRAPNFETKLKLSLCEKCPKYSAFGHFSHSVSHGT